jgi:hypothetical protein
VCGVHSIIVGSMPDAAADDAEPADAMPADAPAEAMPADAPLSDAAPPPPFCGIWAPMNSCDMCLIGNCCSQLLACVANTECGGGLTCFKSCDKPGIEQGCARMCNTAFKNAGDGYVACMSNLCDAACR